MEAISHWGNALQFTVELIAIGAFALSGVMEGARKKLDAVGVCVVAFLTAFGGGTLRDLLLDQRPFFWVEHQGALLGVLGLALAAMLFMKQRHFHITERAIIWPDAIGLGLFTASGVQQTLDSGLPVTVAVLMGVVTGIFGGVLRDMVCNEIPTSFRDHRPYALCAFGGGCVYAALYPLGLPDWALLVACVLVTTGTRALAVVRNWSIPAWRND